MTRLQLSRTLAYVFGVLTPLAETVRRWGTWFEYPPAYLDDVILGALLITGAWASRDASSIKGRALLAAAWGFACGIMYSSITGHWLMLQAGDPDPAPISSEAVFAIKIAGGAVFILGLVLAITSSPEREPTN